MEPSRKSRAIALRFLCGDVLDDANEGVATNNLRLQPSIICMPFDVWLPWYQSLKLFGLGWRSALRKPLELQDSNTIKHHHRTPLLSLNVTHGWDQKLYRREIGEEERLRMWEKMKREGGWEISWESGMKFGEGYWLGSVWSSWKKYVENTE